MISWIKCKAEGCPELIADTGNEGLCWKHHQEKIKAETEKQEIPKRKDEYGE